MRPAGGQIDGMVRLVASRWRGATRADLIESRAPLALRVTGDSGPVLHVSLLHTGAGYFENDRTQVEIEVGEGASVSVSTPGASIAFPSPGNGWSTAEVQVAVRRGGTLAYLPEPLIAAEGCRHRGRTLVDLEDGAEALWREETFAGRTGEAGGKVELSFSADLAGRPFFRDAILLGRDGSAGPRTVARRRFTGTVARLGRRFPDAPGVMQLSGPGSVARAVADDALSLRRKLEGCFAIPAAGPQREQLLAVFC